MSEKEKQHFIVRAAMTEYMILMAGALILYFFVQLWPHSVGLISVMGGATLAAACVINFICIVRTSPLAVKRAEEPINTLEKVDFGAALVQNTGYAVMQHAVNEESSDSGMTEAITPRPPLNWGEG